MLHGRVLTIEKRMGGWRTRQRSNYVSAWLGCALCASLNTPAFSQSPDTTIQSYGDIVVTAQLREQRLRDVPLPVSAYDGETLRALGAVELVDAARFIPGFVAQNQSPNNPGFGIRGVTSDSGASFDTPRVSVFQDGISISRSRGSYVELFDLERLEVIKGPQTTLYGRQALTGAVNLVQNKARPGLTEARVELGIGNDDARFSEAVVNFPIGSAFAVRLAGRLRRRDGYVANLRGGDAFGSTDTKALRAAIHAETDALHVDVIANYQDDHPTGTPFRSIAYAASDPATGHVLAGPSRFGGAALTVPATSLGSDGLGVDRWIGGVSALLHWSPGAAWAFDAAIGYRRFSSLEVLDVDGIALPMLTASDDVRGSSFSQDLRLRYDAGGPIALMLGASWSRETGRQDSRFQFDERVVLGRLAGALNAGLVGKPLQDPGALAAFGDPAFTTALVAATARSRGVVLSQPLAGAIASNLKPNHFEQSINFNRANAVDIYGEMLLKLAPSFDVTFGMRYTSEQTKTSFESSVLNGRSVLGGYLAALGQSPAVRQMLLSALAVPNAALIPFSARYPLPLFGISAQPTAGNGSRFHEIHGDDGLTWRLVMHHDLGPNTSANISYSRGRRPDTLAVRPPIVPGGTPDFTVQPAEIVDNFEFGMKLRSPDHGLAIDTSAFVYDYRNFQTLELQGVRLVVSNAGQARAYGFETQIRWSPVRNLALFAAYAFNHARFRTGAREGNSFRLAPDHSGSAGLTWSLPVRARTLRVSANVTWQSRVYFDDDNDRSALQAFPNRLIADVRQDETQSAYALTNVRVAYELAEGIEVQAFVSNLFNKHYFKDAGNTGDALGMPTFIPGEPRLYGISVRATL